MEEFGLGYPPRIFGIKRGETVYSVNWLLIGGFTKMSGEEDPSAPRSLASKSRATRALVLSAGAIVNALLPFILFSVAYMVPHTVVTGQVTVQEVAAASPAEAAGIVPGDIILSVNGKTIAQPDRPGALHRDRPGQRNDPGHPDAAGYARDTSAWCRAGTHRRGRGLSAYPCSWKTR